MTLHEFKLITKPFWIPAIALIYLLSADFINPFVLTALFFCYIGDLLLMKKGKNWFLAGACFFLIGHLFYIYVFIMSAGGFTVFSDHPVACVLYFIPYAGYAIFLKRFLGQNVSSVFYAVAIYISVLLLMSYASLLRIWAVPTAGFLLTFCGSLLFIASDTLISIRNFKRRFKGIGTIIVVTYITAQIMIILGISAG